MWGDYSKGHRRGVWAGRKSDAVSVLWVARRVIRYANNSTASLGRNDLHICRHKEGRRIKQRWSRKCWR